MLSQMLYIFLVCESSLVAYITSFTKGHFEAAERSLEIFRFSEDLGDQIP